MDVKVLLLCIIKALLEAFLIPPGTQEQWNLSKGVGFVFLGTFFPEILVRHCLPSTESTFECSHLHRFEFQQCCSGTANRNPSKFHHTPGLNPSQTPTEDRNIQPWCSAALKDQAQECSDSMVLSFWSKICRTPSSEFFWASWITGRWLQIPHPKPIPHILKFNSSLLFFPYLFPLQFCDIFCCSENPSWTSAWTFPRKFL